MRPITDKARVAREKLAYICDSTSAPICCLIPFTSWGIYMAGLLVGIGCIADANMAQEVVIRSVPYNFYCYISLVICEFIAFFTGTSWGTYAIMTPIALPLAFSVSGGVLAPVIYATVAAVLGGGCFGDHCSPLSDTTILSSLAAGSDHVDHVKTQIAYAGTAAIFACIGFIIIGLTL